MRAALYMISWGAFLYSDSLGAVCERRARERERGRRASVLCEVVSDERAGPGAFVSKAFYV